MHAGSNDEAGSNEGQQPLSPPDSAAESQLRSALSMLSGRNPGPYLEQARSLIETAAKAGHAEAVARRAVLECKGVGEPVNWEKALDSLAKAASLGSEVAARQLILLADDRYEAKAPTLGRPDGWREVRERISIQRRLQAPPPSGHSLSMAPLVHAVPRLCSVSECQWLISVSEPRLERATVYNAPSGVHQGRTNQSAIFDLSQTDVVVETIRARIADELGAPLPCLEVPQVLRYRVGEEFVLHCDFLDPAVLAEEIARCGQRSATVLIYLNEEFEGGETSFPRLNIRYRGKAGGALVFGSLRPDGMPDPRTQHAGLPPTSGEKWVFSQWVRDRYVV